ncbi:MAG: hypothetical protein JNK49_09380, partial [Planctomycetes bacterium]|nr:hypothetical protein [Planctomycetota bacterium]
MRALKSRNRFSCTLTSMPAAFAAATLCATVSCDRCAAIGAATGTTLFSGSLTVPGAQRIYPFPNPWTIDIPFLQAFLYQRGNGNLLLDLQVSGASGDTWPADGFFFHGVEPR